jgi:hypothetical protein
VVVSGAFAVVLVAVAGAVVAAAVRDVAVSGAFAVVLVAVAGFVAIGVAVA